MKPELNRFFEVAAAHVMMKTAPALPPGYEQSTATVLGALLMCVREEHDRAAARRYEENAALRALFAEAQAVVDDAGLRERLAVAAETRDDDMRVSALEQSNAGLRVLLIDLHAHVEELHSDAARRIERAIWRELVASTERRRLSMGPY